MLLLYCSMVVVNWTDNSTSNIYCIFRSKYFITSKSKPIKSNSKFHEKQYMDIRLAPCECFEIISAKSSVLFLNILYPSHRDLSCSRLSYLYVRFPYTVFVFHTVLKLFFDTTALMVPQQPSTATVGQFWVSNSETSLPIVEGPQ